MNSPTQIRIDSDVKKHVKVLFANLGLDMSSAINLFLRQCLLRGGLPFTVEDPNYNKETLNAMKEAKKITKNKKVKSYKTIEDLNNALNKD